MKYIDAEKLIAEIERRRDICKAVFERESDTYYQGKAVAYGELLSFLDTLSEEPDNEDLNDEIKKYIEEYGYERGGDKLLIAIVARHFAQWGAEHFRGVTKMIDKSLEEAAEKRAIEYAEKEKSKDAEGEIWRVGDVMIENRMSFEDAFKAGAEWQASQMPMPEDTVLFNKGVAEGRRLEREDMLKEAVGGVVCYGSKGAYIETDFLGEYDTDVYGNPGDKVRIVVLKEEE